MKPSIAARLLLVLFVLCGILASRSLAPPTPKPATAPAVEFSAGRARETLLAIAREPRPMGSAAHDRARDWLVERLRSLGVEPQVQTTTVLADRGVAGTVANVLARLPGRKPGKAVLLMAHYDSVPAGPGASDDASGVATLLETLRALTSGEALQNDVIFLFTDGEEVALFGAQAFADQHPWAEEVGVVLNFEARGAGGPSLMFETGPGNGALVRTLGRAAPRPVAFSFSYEVYRRMPNDTDFTVFRRKGKPGLNFAYIHDPAAYHTAQDTIERLDLASVQHHGDAALALTRAFGNQALPPAAEANAVYFNLLGPVFVRYPGSWVLPLTLALAVATVAVLVMGLRRRRFTVGGLFAGSLACLLATGAVGYLAALLAPLAFPGPHDFTLWGSAHSTSLVLWGMALAAAALAVVVARLLAPRVQGEGLAAGGLVVWLALAVAVAFAAPGASALVGLPLGFGLAMAALGWRIEPGAPLTASTMALAALAVVVTAFVWVPVLGMVGVALGQGAAPVVAGAAVFLTLGLFATVLSWARPQRGGWGFAAGTLLAALALIAVVRLAAVYGPENRRPNSLLYVLDAGAGTARWATYDRRPDAWVSKLISGSGERENLPPAFGTRASVLTSPAPLPGPAAEAALAPAEVTASRFAAAGGASGNGLRLSFSWPEPVARAVVTLRSAAALGEVRVNGRTMPGPSTAGPGGPADDGKQRTLLYYAPPAEGLAIELASAGAQPIEVEVVTQRFGLPEVPGVTLEPRPPDTMPLSVWSTDSSLVHSKTVIDLSALPPPGP